MVNYVTFYKSTRCTHGFYVEASQDTAELPTTCERNCQTCKTVHQFALNKNYLANTPSAVKLLKDWADKNSYEFDVPLEDIQ